MASGNDYDELKKARTLAKSRLTKKVNVACEILNNCDDTNVAQNAIIEAREALKSYQLAHEAYHIQLIDPIEIQASNEHYKACIERVAEIETKFKSLVTQTHQSTSQLQPQDSISNVGSKISKLSSIRSSASSKARAAAKKAALEAKAASLKDVHKLEAQELQIKQKKAEVELQAEIAAAKAEEQVYEDMMAEEQLSSTIHNVTTGDLINNILKASGQDSTQTSVIAQDTAGQSSQAQDNAGQSTQANIQDTAGQSTQANAQHAAGPSTLTIPQDIAGQSSQVNAQDTAGQSSQAQDNAGQSTQANFQDTGGQSTQANAQHAAGQSTLSIAQDTAAQSSQANAQDNAGQSTQANFQDTAGKSIQANAQHAAGQSSQVNAQDTAAQSSQANAQETADQSSQVNAQETADQSIQTNAQVTADQSTHANVQDITKKSMQAIAQDMTVQSTQAVPQVSADQSIHANVQENGYLSNVNPIKSKIRDQQLKINRLRSTPSEDIEGFKTHFDTNQTPLSSKQPVHFDPGFSGWSRDPTNQYHSQASSLQEDFVSKLLETQTSHNRALEEIVRQQQQSVAALNLPQPTVQVFSGDPVEYCEFMRAFEHLIESKTSNASARLYYLVQYTTGSVQELMRSCLSMEPQRGYIEAKRLLKERYGQAHRIATAHIQRLVDGPSIKTEDAIALQQFAIQLTSCTNTLTQIGYIGKLDSQDVLRKIIDRLPFSMRTKWRDTVDNILENQNRDVTVKDITKFVNAKARAASHPIFGKIDASKPATTAARNNKLPFIPNHRTVKAVSFGTRADHDRQTRVDTDKAKPKCPLCNLTHWLVRCDKFKGKSTEERLKFVREKKLCDNCLSYGHYAKSCIKDSFCKVEGCTNKHSTFLHQKSLASEPNSKAGNDAAKNSSQKETSIQANNGLINMSTQSPISKTISLAIVPVKVKVPGKTQTVETYAFLDNGSNATFCTEDLLDKLGIKGNRTSVLLNTLMDNDSLVKCQLVRLEVTDLNQNHVVTLPRVLSTQSLPVSTKDMAKQSDIDSWQHLRNISVPKLNAEIGLLIGSDVPSALAPLEIKRGKNGGPYATRTLLGWSVNGPLKRNEQNAELTTNCLDAEDSLTKQFERYCNLEFRDTSSEDQVAMSQNDHKALTIMESTVIHKDNHYEIALPWKQFPPHLEDNKSMAERRLNILKGKFQRDSNTFDKYKTFIDDLIVKDYARQVTPSDESLVPIWYLPHHSVQHPQKPNKVRVVFDCSAKWRGTSLNDQLLQGPDLTNSLVGVLTRFRQEPIALMADIEAMFHQVRVRPSDCNALRFLWWPNGDLNSPPVDYQMMVHLFGATSSPSCANFALKKTAKDNEQDFDPITVETILSNFYVDDCLKSVPTSEEAIRLATQLRELLSRGGFRLTKWMSNDKTVLESIPESERAAPVKDLDFDSNLNERALGVRWNVQNDEFNFKISIKDKPATRRGILSIVSSIYDPMGFVSPCILPAKVLLQELCRKQLKWDDPIPHIDQKKWQEWLNDLPNLEKFSVKRCFKPRGPTTIKSYELHHFSDASERGYGAASYLRMIDENGKAHCILVMAKSRLTPLKTVTIPRLELCAAVLATKLDRIIRKELTIPIGKSTFWTDSTCVLRYIMSKTKRFQVFVANRVSSILEQSEESQWRHVDTTNNPADDASRGLSVNEFLENKRWLHGPEFLSQAENDWPKQPLDIGVVNDDDPEVRNESRACAIDASKPDPISEMFQRFSSWIHLKKTVAWILRLKTNLRQRAIQRRDGKPNERSTLTIAPLSVTELKAAELAILQHVQGQHFKEELRQLSHVDKSSEKPASVKVSSDIYKLDPFLDEGLLRVGGRLHKAPIDSNAKHPVILPKKHPIVTLIVRHFHDVCGHSGLEYTLSLIRQRFWIIKARPAVQRVLNECFSCRRRQAPVVQQKMASLPEDRLTPSKPPFTYVGVDCFGPFVVRRGRTTVKRYGVLFTCLTSRAVHIEVASSLDTESFINALRRFIARRGQPEEMRSDNGGNFVKGERELKEAVQQWNHSQIHEHLLQRDIKWKFNPPAGSHHGGVWERCIRSVRKVMKAILTEQVLDDEGLNTLMCEVESIVNGRPITKLSDDPRDLEPLTPNHLLLLRAGTKAPPGTFDKCDNYTKRRWRQVQYLADVFWRRWTREYLPSLQERQKWNKEKRNIAVNDVVILLDENTPRSSWPLGRIEEVFTNGSDGLVRSVKLRTNRNVLVRPVDKIVLLESAAKPATDK